MAKPHFQAEHAVLVALAEKSGQRLNELSLAQLRSVEKSFTNDALKVFNLKKALALRKGTGAPGTREVHRQLARWKNLLK